MTLSFTVVFETTQVAMRSLGADSPRRCPSRRRVKSLLQNQLAKQTLGMVVG